MANQKIDTEVIKTASQKLLEIEENVRTLAMNIQTCAQELRSGYNDDAGAAFIQKIGELDADLQKVVAMIDEHGQELSQTATDVENALEESRGRANALSTAGIS